MAYGGKMIPEESGIYVFFKEPMQESVAGLYAFRDLFEAQYMASNCHFKTVEATRFRLAVQSLSLVLDTEPLHVQPPWANEKLRLAEKLMKEALELMVQAEADSGTFFPDIGAAIGITPSSYTELLSFSYARPNQPLTVLFISSTVHTVSWRIFASLMDEIA